MIQRYAAQIFNKYLQCHLSAPDGLRDIANITARFYDQQIDEYEPNDSEQYKEQLILIGTFAREDPGHALPILCKLLEQKARIYHAELQKAYSNGSTLAESGPSDQLKILYEDIHWLLLISTHVLSMECVGEQPLIPSEIMQYSVQKINARQTDIETSLKLLAAPSQCISEFANAENTADHVVRLVASVFRLCEIENKAIESRLTPFLSPEISANIMLFLQLWSESYLFMEEVFYTNVSTIFRLKFRR